jgi:predicted transcriptional regulator
MAQVKKKISVVTGSGNSKVELKRRVLFELYLKILETIDQMPSEMSPDDVAVYAFVYVNQMQGKKTHAKLFPDYIGLSQATLSRKLNDLVNRGILERKLMDRVYYYGIPQAARTTFYRRSDGSLLLDGFYEKMIDLIEELVGS